MFVYDAVRELLLLGDTVIKATELRKIISKLESVGGGSYQQQFDVSDSIPCWHISLENESCSWFYTEPTQFILKALVI